MVRIETDVEGGVYQFRAGIDAEISGAGLSSQGRRCGKAGCPESLKVVVPLEAVGGVGSGWTGSALGRAGEMMRRRGSLQKLAPQRLGDEFGVGFALGGFHDLAGEEVEELFVAALDLGDLVGVGGDDFVDDHVDRTGVGRFVAEFLGDGCGVFLRGLPERFKDLLGLVVGDQAGLDEVDGGGKFFRSDGAVGGGEIVFVEMGEEGVDDPVGGLLWRGFGRLGRGFKILRKVLIRSENGRVVVREAHVSSEAGGFFVGALGDELAHAVADDARLHGKEVRVGEVAVIVGVFLGPHELGDAHVVVPAAGGLDCAMSASSSSVCRAIS